MPFYVVVDGRRDRRCQTAFGPGCCSRWQNMVPFPSGSCSTQWISAGDGDALWYWSPNQCTSIMGKFGKLLFEAHQHTKLMTYIYLIAFIALCSWSFSFSSSQSTRPSEDFSNSCVSFHFSIMCLHYSILPIRTKGKIDERIKWQSL